MTTIVTNFIFPRLHYLFYATFSLMGGISFYHLYPKIYLSAGISALAVLLILVIQYLFVKPVDGVVVTPIIFFLGSVLCFYHNQKFDSFYRVTQNNRVSFKGTVINIERICNNRFKGTLTLDISSVTIDNTTQDLRATIIIYLKEIPEIRVGDEIEVHDILVKKNERESYSNYLLKEKIAASLFVESFKYSLISRPKISLNRFVSEFKEHTLLNLKSKIDKETFQLFSSIFLGNRALVKKQMNKTKEPFKIWGISHYLARSGLHLVIFVLIWNFILALLPLSYIIKQLFLLLLIFGYALLSWSSVSFERALLMVAIYKLCNLWGIGCHYVHLIVLVTALVLCNNPYQLFFLDFQLSFGLTFALAWFKHIEARKKLSYS